MAAVPVEHIAANALFTLGPLHFFHFTGVTPPASGSMLAAILVIGLFFGVLFHRSGNLWIVGLFHGLGNWYSVGLRSVAMVQSGR